VKPVVLDAPARWTVEPHTNHASNMIDHINPSQHATKCICQGKRCSVVCFELFVCPWDIAKTWSVGGYGVEQWIRETKNTTLFTVADIATLPLSLFDSQYRFWVEFLYCFWLCFGSNLGVNVFKSGFGRLHSMWLTTGHLRCLNKQVFDSGFHFYLTFHILTVYVEHRFLPLKTPFYVEENFKVHTSKFQSYRTKADKKLSNISMRMVFLRPILQEVASIMSVAAVYHTCLSNLRNTPS